MASVDNNPLIYTRNILTKESINFCGRVLIIPVNKSYTIYTFIASKIRKYLSIIIIPLYRYG